MMAESHGLQFIDCGNGHVQIKGHGQLVHSYDLMNKNMNPTCFADYEWKVRFKTDAKFNASVQAMARAMLDYIIT